MTSPGRGGMCWSSCPKTGADARASTAKGAHRNFGMAVPFAGREVAEFYGRNGGKERCNLPAPMRAVMTVLPMAFVMVAGPQIVTAILLATSVRPRRDSVAFLFGSAAATILGLTAAYELTGLLRKAAWHSGHDQRLEHAIDVGIVVLLLVLSIKVFQDRARAQPPRWMARLEAATPAFALRIGFLLFLLMPGNIVSMATAGAYLARHDAAWWHGLIVAAFTVVLAGIPLFVLMLLGQRAKALLPRTRDWMTRNSWIVSEVVIAFFLLMTLKGLLEGDATS